MARTPAKSHSSKRSVPPTPSSVRPSKSVINKSRSPGRNKVVVPETGVGEENAHDKDADGQQETGIPVVRAQKSRRNSTSKASMSKKGRSLNRIDLNHDDDEELDELALLPSPGKKSLRFDLTDKTRKSTIVSNRSPLTNSPKPTSIIKPVRAPSYLPSYRKGSDAIGKSKLSNEIRMSDTDSDQRNEYSDETDSDDTNVGSDSSMSEEEETKGKAKKGSKGGLKKRDVHIKRYQQFDEDDQELGDEEQTMVERSNSPAGSDISSSESSSDEFHLPKPPSPQTIKQQLKERDLALTAAQERQIQEITDHLTPLCVSVQKLYGGFQGGLNKKMKLQWQLYCNALGKEIETTGNAVDTFMKEASEIDTAIALARTKLTQVVEGKRNTLEKGRKDMKKMHSRQVKEMQEVDDEFEALYKSYVKKMNVIEDPARKEKHMEKKRRSYAAMGLF